MDNGVSRPEGSTSQLPSPSSDPHVLSALSSMMVPEHSEGGCWYQWPNYGWTLSITYARHFDQPWISALTIPYGKKKFLWPRLTATLIYGYKYIEDSLTYSSTVRKWIPSSTYDLPRQGLCRFAIIGLKSLLWGSPQIPARKQVGILIAIMPVCTSRRIFPGGSILLHARPITE